MQGLAQWSVKHNWWSWSKNLFKAFQQYCYHRDCPLQNDLDTRPEGCFQFRLVQRLEPHGGGGGQKLRGWVTFHFLIIEGFPFYWQPRPRVTSQETLRDIEI